MLRILANENIPLDVVDCLRAAGHDVTWIRADAPGLDDIGVLAIAERERRTLLTFDKDFGELALRCRLPAECGVILARLRPISSRALAETILAAVSSRADWAGHFSVIAVGRIRMTPIPQSPNVPSLKNPARKEHGT